MGSLEEPPVVGVGGLIYPGQRANRALAARHVFEGDLGTCDECRAAPAICVYRLRALCGPCLEKTYAGPRG